MLNQEEFTNQTWFHLLWRFADVKDVVNSRALEIQGLPYERTKCSYPSVRLGVPVIGVAWMRQLLFLESGNCINTFGPFRRFILEVELLQRLRTEQID